MAGSDAAQPSPPLHSNRCYECLHVAELPGKSGPSSFVPENADGVVRVENALVVVLMEETHDFEHVEVTFIQEVLTIHSPRYGALRISEMGAEDLALIEEVGDGSHGVFAHFVDGADAEQQAVSRLRHGVRLNNTVVTPA